MQIEKSGDLFIARIKFSERDLFRQDGWYWDTRLRKWVTSDILKVRKFKDFTVGDAREAMKEFEREAGRAIDASMATDSDIFIPLPDHQTRRPFPYQKAGVAYAISREGVLIGDGPGLGKSNMAVLTVNLMKRVRRGLIICPASLKKNWTREWRMWSIHTGLTIGIVTTITEDALDADGKPIRKPSDVPGRLGPKIKRTRDVWPDTDIVIINKNLFERHEDALKERVWDFLIVDEAHEYCNEKAKSSGHIWGHGRGKNRVLPIMARKRIFLTGTPITKKPKNLWVFAKALDPKGLGKDWFDFHERYCGAEKTNFGYYTDGATNLQELNRKLRSSFMVRREKTEVLKELPPKTREIVLLPDDGMAKTVERELTQVRSFLAKYQKATGLKEDDNFDGLLSVSASYEDMSYEELAGAMSNRMTLAFEEMSRARCELAIAKAPLVVEHVERILATGEKVILFCYHKEVAQAFKKAFKGRCAFVTGSTPSSKRQDQVDMFQEDEDCVVFIGNIAAAGVGFTLTAASVVVFAEVSWVPSELEQAEDRAWRIGQDCNVLVQHLVIEGSIDARMIEVILERIEQISEALDARHV